MGFVPDQQPKPAGRFVPDDPTKVTAYIDKRDQEAKVKPFQPGPLEAAGRYLADYGQGIRDAATQPVGGPTGIPLVDAAAGVADFGASAAWDTLTAVPRLATQAFVGARGGQAPPDLFTRTPTTPTGRAIADTAGAIFKPVGDALGATGLPAPVSQFLVEAGGTALDVAGLKGAARGARPVARLAGQGDFTPPPGPARPRTAAELGAGVDAIPDPVRGGGQPLGAERAALSSVQRQVGTDLPDPGGPLRPYGPEVEQARRLGYRVMPSQVDAKAQMVAPLGSTGTAPPGTIRQTFAGPTLKDRFTIDNQKRTNIFAAKELGISEITEQGLELAKYPHNAVFNELTRTVPYIRRDAGLEEAANLLGGARRNNPLLRQTREVEMIRDRLLSADVMTTQQVLDAIRELRKDARIAFQKVGDVEAEQAATAYRGAADALEEALERQAGVVDKTLIPRLKDARTALAKIHNVQDAFDGTNVDAQALAKLAEKYPLTGYLNEIATAATNFPDTMRSATGLTIKEPSNQSLLMSLNLATRRAAGREQVPTLMSDEFQARYGAQDPNYDPRPAPTPPAAPAFVEYQPPGPDALPPPGSTMPPAPGGGPGLAATGLAEDFDTLPPAEARPGDLTAEIPPMGGSDIMPDATGARGASGGPEDIRLLLQQADTAYASGDTALANAIVSEIERIQQRPTGAESRRLTTELGLEPPTPPRTPDTIDFANDPELAALFAGDDPLRQNVPQAPGGDALDLGADLTEPLTDLELLDLQLQTAAPPGSIGPVRPRPLPPDEDLGAAMVEPEPGPQPSPQPLGLADELTAEPPPVVDLAEARGPRSPVPEGRQVEGTKFEVRDNAPADLVDGHLFPRGSTVIHEGPANNPTRWVVMSKDGDRLRISYLNNEKGSPGGAQDLIVRAAREAEARGVPLDFDSEVKVGAYRALKRAVEKGLVTVDNWPEAEAAFKAAFERDPAQAVNKSGEPFAKGIRVGPAG